MNIRLDGHVAVVTGGGNGIGEAVCVAMADSGAKVVVADFDLPGAERVASQIGGERAIAVKVDVTQRPQVEAMYQQALDTFGGADILFLSAGNLRINLLHKMADEEWDSVIATHLKGHYLSIRCALDHMRQKQWGRILCVTSPAIEGTVGQANYSAAKGGIVSLMRSVAREYAREGITCNCILPVAATAMTEKVRTDPKLSEIFLRNIPMKRWAGPEEIAPTAVFLASDHAAYITGQTLGVNGGRTMW